MTNSVAPYRTVLLAAFEGWNDASQAATDALRHLIDTYTSQEVRSIRCDRFYDYQETRPIVCHCGGRRRILWPQTTFFDITVNEELHILAQIAPEPNYHWLDYCRQSLAIGEEFEVDQVITLGSMFAQCPHTRPLPVDISDGKEPCDLDRDYSGPVGIPTILDDQARSLGYDASSIWVSVPQYAGTESCSPASIRLLQALETTLQTKLSYDSLLEKAKVWQQDMDQAVSFDENMKLHVAQLEQEFDLEQSARDIAAPGTVQSRRLIKEAEDFLKGYGDAPIECPEE